MNNPKISIVTTLYQSEKYVVEFYERSLKAVKKISNNYEFIFIDDGYPDKAAEIAEALVGPIKVVRFSRNFGHHRAMMAACEHASGEYVFLIDADLEEEPELIDEFWHEMNKNDDIDVCYGIQEKRKGKIIERISGIVFYKFFNYLSDISIPENLLTIRLMSRRYVDALLLHREKELFVAGIWKNTGFTQNAIKVHKHDKGETSYSLGQKINLLINSVTSFSKKPLVLIFNLSLIIIVTALSYSLYTAYHKLKYPESPMGYASQMISIWFLGGLILFSIGIVGIYMSKLFGEVKDRPTYIIKKITDKTSEFEND